MRYCKTDFGYLKTLIFRIFNYLDLDRAVFYGLLTKLWGLTSGPLTAILIAIHFTPEIQGYYYTFGTILALQIFIELGLGTVIIQFASHEWSKLSLNEYGQIKGDKDSLSRLSSIAVIASKWYLLGGLLIAIGLAIGGTIFFSSSNDSVVFWRSPWIALCLIEGVSICLVPAWSLLEGCNQVGSIYTFRFFKGLLMSISIWLGILLGAELWTTVISAFSVFIFSLIYLRRRYWNFFKTLLYFDDEGPKINWKVDMLPMQWRIALSWISGYFIFSFFVPVLFKFQGPLVAGQMGMTWGIISIVGSLPSSWLSPRAPQFGILIAQKRYEELDRQFSRIKTIVIGMSASLACIIWLSVWILNYLPYGWALNLASRILSPLPVGLLLMAQLVYTAASPYSIYLRAHKKEPLMYISILYAFFIGCSTFFLEKKYSVTGIAAGYLIVNIFLFPLIYFAWRYYKNKWHKLV